jgi:hypothetical protein
MGETEELIAAVEAISAYYVAKHSSFRLMYYTTNIIKKV